MTLTQGPRLGTGADDEVVRLARPDVLQRQDAPVPVALAHPDVLHPLTSLGQGQHLRHNRVNTFHAGQEWLLSIKSIGDLAKSNSGQYNASR